MAYKYVALVSLHRCAALTWRWLRTTVSDEQRAGALRVLNMDGGVAEALRTLAWLLLANYRERPSINIAGGGNDRWWQ